MGRSITPGFLIVLWGFCLCSPARGEKLRSTQILERARAHFQTGQQAYEQGKYESALHEFQQSHALSKNPVLYFNMAACEERLDHPVAAAQLLRQYLVEKPTAEDRLQVENRIRVLDQHDQQIQKAQESSSQPKSEASTPPTASVPTVPTAQPQPAQKGPRFRWAWAGLGVTGAFGIAAIGTGSYAVVHHSDLKSSCGANGCSQPQIDGLRSATVATDVLIGITAAAAITTVVLFVVEGRRSLLKSDRAERTAHVGLLMRTRPWSLALSLGVSLTGCSLLFDGSDLRGPKGADLSLATDGFGAADLAGGVDLAGADLAGADIAGVAPRACGNKRTTLMFSTLPGVSVGPTPFALVAADLDNDGKLDVATANNDGNNVTVLKGAGDGTLANLAGSPFATCTGPNGIAAGLLDGDSKIDLAITCSASGPAALTVLLGKSSPPTRVTDVTLPMNSAPIGVAIGDLDADTKADIAISTDGMLTVLIGNGDGTTKAQTKTFAAGTGSGALVIGKINGDDLLDVAIASDFDIKVLTNSTSVGTIGFSLAAPSTFNDLVYGLVGGALRGGGPLDLVTAAGSSLGILLNSSGAFPASPPTAPSSGAPIDVALADFDCDGNLDAVTVDVLNETVGLLPGDGNGNFGSPQLFPMTSTTPGSVTIGDFNGDHLPDIAIANRPNGGANGSVIILKNTSQ